MPYGIKEFEERVIDICDRWYVTGGPILAISGSRCRPILRPIQVWEVPYAQGEGFKGDTLIMEIGDEEEFEKTGFWSVPTPNHLVSLRRGHWNRVRAKQVEEIRQMNRANAIREIKNKHQQDFENKVFAKENRHLFAKSARDLGLSKVSMRDTCPRKMVFNSGV